MLAFDQDGMLLISTGDGGSAYDPHDNALDPASLLGKILRIDVDRGWPYAIPEGNGFEDVPGARAEVHAVGLRNPWRFSKDPATGDIYIADVGQAFWEEINVLRPGEREVSFGWNQLEGEGCLLDKPCDPSLYRAPALTYPHVYEDIGHCAIIGGDVYRGAAGSLPDGTYLYGDYCSGTIWAVPVEQLVAGDAAPRVAAKLDPTLGQIMGFGQDDAGELYVLTSAGQIYRFSEARSPA
jgi:glucose/arabinose dehydrogenase